MQKCHCLCSRALRPTTRLPLRLFYINSSKQEVVCFHWDNSMHLRLFTCDLTLTQACFIGGETEAQKHAKTLRESINGASLKIQVCLLRVRVAESWEVGS